MKQMRKKWLLPILAFAIAIGGAFATNIETTESAVPIGYATLQKPCDTQVSCSTIPNPVCRAPGGQQAWGKNNPTDGHCPNLLFMP